MKWSKIINWNPFVSKREGRFNIIGKNAYKFDRWLFNSTIVIILCLLFYVFYTYDFDFSPRVYYKCDEDNKGCENPFYIDNMDSPLALEDKLKCKFDWCNKPVLPAGFEGGERPTPLYNNIGKVCYTLFFLVLLLNHFLYNRGKIKQFGDSINLEED